MLNQKSVHQEDFESLLHELDEISGDMSEYLNFLIQRRSLIKQVFSQEAASNN